MVDSNKIDFGLAADIFAGVHNVLTVNPEKCKQISEILNEIDEALIQNYSGVILYANKRACTLLPEIVFAPQSGVNRIHEDELYAMPYRVQRDSLLSIRKALVNAAEVQKFGHALMEVGYVAIKQEVRKVLNNR